MLPDLKALYAAEPDGLFWFAGDSAHPALAGALEAIALSDQMGLNPADYDAALLAKKWESIRSGAGVTPADRALFDVALSAVSMRVLQSVHWGRVDPRLVGFDYDVTVQAARPRLGSSGPRGTRAASPPPSPPSSRSSPSTAAS